MTKKKRGYIDIGVIVTQEDEHFCSWAPQLDIASCGCTQEEAVSYLQDAVNLYLQTLAEEGELEQVLEEKGIRIVVAGANIPSCFVTQYRQVLPEKEE